MGYSLKQEVQWHQEPKERKVSPRNKMNRIRWLSAGIVSESAFFRIPFFLLRYYVDQRMSQKKVYDS